MELPISVYLPQISAAVEKSRFTIIRAPPGSGKSTLIPQYLLNCAKSIVLTTPRRSAAFALHRFMSNSGVSAGLLMRGVRELGGGDQLIIATEGSALLSQLNADIYIFDEAHELTDELQMLLADFKMRFSCDSESGFPHVVLMSATLDCGCFLRYLGAYQCEVISIDVRRPFDVEIRLSKTRFSDYQSYFMSEMKRLIASALAMGPVLAFLPGKREIDILRAEFAYVQPYTFHSRSNNLAALVSRQHELILATDAAETSLTLQNLAAVVDSGVRKRPRFINGGRCLQLDFISADARAQRIGRLGRVRAGCYLAAYNEEIWRYIDLIKHEPSPDPFKFCAFLAQRHCRQLGTDQRCQTACCGAYSWEFVHPCALELLCQYVDKMASFGYFAPPIERGILDSQSARLLKLGFLGSFERIGLAAVCASAGHRTALAGAALTSALGVLEEIDFRAILAGFADDKSDLGDTPQREEERIAERSKDSRRGQRIALKTVRTAEQQTAYHSYEQHRTPQEPVQKPLNEAPPVIFQMRQRCDNDFLVLLRHAAQCIALGKSYELSYAFLDVCNALELKSATDRSGTGHRQRGSAAELALDSETEGQVMKIVQQAYRHQTAQFALNWSIAGRAAFVSRRSAFQPFRSGAREVVYESLFSAGGALEMVCVAERDAE